VALVLVVDLVLSFSVPTTPDYYDAGAAGLAAVFVLAVGCVGISTLIKSRKFWLEFKSERLRSTRYKSVLLMVLLPTSWVAIGVLLFFDISPLDQVPEVELAYLAVNCSLEYILLTLVYLIIARHMVTRRIFNSSISAGFTSGKSGPRSDQAPTEMGTRSTTRTKGDSTHAAQTTKSAMADDTSTPSKGATTGATTTKESFDSSQGRGDSA